MELALITAKQQQAQSPAYADETYIVLSLATAGQLAAPVACLGCSETLNNFLSSVDRLGERQAIVWDSECLPSHNCTTDEPPILHQVS